MSAGGKPLYTPFETPYRLSMGLIALKPDEWIEIDDDLAADLAEKRRLLAERHAQVFAALTGSEAGQREVLDLLAAHLTEHFPDLYRRDGRRLRVLPADADWDLDDAGLAPLDLAGRLVQEDLCLMEHDDAAWRLTAASLCFPTRWKLADKIGRPLDAIHGPVPDFADKLARPISRFFDRIKTDKPVWRLNWSLIDDPALFQPEGHGRGELDPTITAENAGERLWLRVERQTLRRLPATDAVLFTIRIHRWPLSRLADRPEAAGRLAQSITTMPPAMQRYKSLPVFGDAVKAYLEKYAG